MLYVKSLAPHTINTMSEVTLRALAEHGEIDAMLPCDGGDPESVLTEFTRTGIDLEAPADQVQNERRHRA